MAETLKWPQSLMKQVHIEQKAQRQQQPAYLKMFLILVIMGLGLTFTAWLYFKNILAGLYLFLFWLFISFMVTYGYKILASGPESTKTLQGARGEAAVALELDKLPAGWFIINDIVINGRQVDHVAVGPAGIFCLETKNWNHAGCDRDGTWYHFHTGHWVPVNKNPTQQCAAHAAALEKYLQAKLGPDTGVNPVVVLAHPRGNYNIDSRVVPPGNTVICLTAELHRLLLKNTSPVLGPDKARNIARTLAGI